jgi:hypothetical protein
MVADATAWESRGNMFHLGLKYCSDIALREILLFLSSPQFQGGAGRLLFLKQRRMMFRQDKGTGSARCDGDAEAGREDRVENLFQSVACSARKNVNFFVGRVRDGENGDAISPDGPEGIRTRSGQRVQIFSATIAASADLLSCADRAIRHSDCAGLEHEGRRVGVHRLRRPVSGVRGISGALFCAEGRKCRGVGVLDSCRGT